LSERTIEVRLANKLGYERVAMACSACFAQMMGLSPERIEDLKTVVAEAAINVSVMDEGDGIKKFPPTPDIERIIEKLDPPVGFGLFLIKQLADQVEFNKIDGGHVVNMAIKMNS
jgi:anti-sigma regulatory factor (Ser/Thr protein kinase)